MMRWVWGMACVGLVTMTTVQGWYNTTVGVSALENMDCCMPGKRYGNNSCCTSVKIDDLCCKHNSVVVNLTCLNVRHVGKAEQDLVNLVPSLEVFRWSWFVMLLTSTLLVLARDCIEDGRMNPVPLSVVCLLAVFVWAIVAHIILWQGIRLECDNPPNSHPTRQIMYRYPWDFCVLCFSIGVQCCLVVVGMVVMWHNCHECSQIT